MALLGRLASAEINYFSLSFMERSWSDSWRLVRKEVRLLGRKQRAWLRKFHVLLFLAPDKSWGVEPGKAHSHTLTHTHTHTVTKDDVRGYPHGAAEGARGVPPPEGGHGLLLGEEDDGTGITCHGVCGGQEGHDGLVSKGLKEA